MSEEDWDIITSYEIPEIKKSDSCKGHEYVLKTTYKNFPEMNGFKMFFVRPLILFNPNYTPKGSAVKEVSVCKHCGLESVVRK